MEIAAPYICFFILGCLISLSHMFAKAVRKISLTTNTALFVSAIACYAIAVLSFLTHALDAFGWSLWTVGFTLLSAVLAAIPGKEAVSIFLEE